KNPLNVFSSAFFIFQAIGFKKCVSFLNAFSTVSATKKRRVIVFSPLFCFFTTGLLGLCNRCVPISFLLVLCISLLGCCVYSYSVVMGFFLSFSELAF